MTILHVEDNPDASFTLALLLRMKGHEVDTAADGPGAVRAFDPARHEAVLLDLGLPGLSGWDVARHIRAQNGDIFLVALSGYGMTDDRRKSREAGIDRHLLKPVDPVELLAILEKKKCPTPKGPTPRRQTGGSSRNLQASEDGLAFTRALTARKKHDDRRARR